MTKTQFKKCLSELNQQELIDLLVNLYSSNQEVRKYLEFALTNNESELIENYKNIIGKELDLFNNNPPKLMVCRKAINDYIKLNPSFDSVADLMLFYCEKTVRLLRCLDAGDSEWERIYMAQGNTFDRAMKWIKKYNLLEMFQKRIDKILELSDDASCYDDLIDIYKEVFE